MDACYGGLALTRGAIPPGSMRFLKDMLQRYSRQVLTAGKADEVVSDAGGTRPGHSVFTSHLLDGLEGAATSFGGILTGHALMAYVYKSVGSDAHSHQTPHFGFVDGDGDFIFDTSALAALEKKPDSEPEPDLDVFIKAPTYSVPSVPSEESSSETLKRLMGNPSEGIALYDYVNELIRRAVEMLNVDRFPPQTPISNEEFASRLQRYEEAIKEVEVAAILLARWGKADQLYLIEKIFARISEVEKPQGGTVLWLNLNWYPIFLLMYSTGISALSGRRYEALWYSLHSPIDTSPRWFGERTPPVIVPTVQELTGIVEAFKRLPDMERKYVPRSEHIFKRLQPLLEDELFLGRSYEKLFDDFEILLALSYANVRDEDPRHHVWGPPGRFAWKERGRDNDPVYSNFVREAKAQGDEWGPLRAGLFRRSAQRFSDIADAYGQLLSRVNWW